MIWMYLKIEMVFEVNAIGGHKAEFKCFFVIDVNAVFCRLIIINDNSCTIE